MSGRILAIHHRPPLAAEAGGVAAQPPALHHAGQPPSDADPAATSPPMGLEDPLWRVAEVDFGGVRQLVSLACLPEAREGDQVLVHVGIALALVH
ncbi:MAG: HypC/HybG/HupF family hydrogenase formation chaperone [Synechococcaceae cyanobacterium]